MSDHGDLPESEAAGPEDQPVLTRDDLQGSRRSLPLSNETVGLAVVAVLAILMIGFILGRVTGSDEEEDPAAAAAAAAATGGGVSFPGGDVDRAGYWAFAQITPAIKDSFDRAGPATGLGPADEGGRWTSVEGTWRIEANQAMAVAPEGRSSRSIAIIDGGGGNTSVLIEATLMTSAPGAGLVVRYQDPDNFWAVTADAGGAAWTVTKVIDGQVALTDTVPAPSADGATIAVSQRPSRLIFLVEGAIKLQLQDTALGDQARSGLIALTGDAGPARWDRFFVGNLPPGG